MYAYMTFFEDFKNVRKFIPRLLEHLRCLLTSMLDGSSLKNVCDNIENI